MKKFFLSLNLLLILICWGCASSVEPTIKEQAEHLYWYDYAQNPLLVKLNSAKDNYGLINPFVLKENDGYKMWFTGVSNSSVSYIYYAVSTDGLNWQRVSYEPVLSPGRPGSWDSQHVSTGAVIKVNDEYRLYYTGWSDYRDKWQIGMAVSTDGILWEKHPDPVLRAGDDYDRNISTTCVLKVGNEFVMYYDGGSSGFGVKSEYVALSQDGINWTKSGPDPVLYPEYDWESTMTAHCSIIQENNRFIMIYEGRNVNGLESIGLAYSEDGLNWQKHFGNPILTAANVVKPYNEPAYPMFINTGDEYRIYYVGIKSVSETELCVFRRIVPNNSMFDFDFQN